MPLLSDKFTAPVLDEILAISRHKGLVVCPDKPETVLVPLDYDTPSDSVSFLSIASKKGSVCRQRKSLNLRRSRYVTVSSQ